MSSGRRVSAGSDAEAGARKALDLMVEALELLDMHDGPRDVCAHLDLAIDRLRTSTDLGDEAES